MGLMDHMRRRGYVWQWRLRYWWVDTESGARARVGGFVLALLVLVAQLIRMAVAVAALPQQAAPAPQQAVYWWVVQLVILVVAAAISYALRPKVEPPQDQQHEAPTVQDGTAARDYFGTVWIEHDDNFLLAWKVVGRDPIYTKSGKK